MNRELEAKARALVEIKGYVTNLRVCPEGNPVTVEFVNHQLFQIEPETALNQELIEHLRLTSMSRPGNEVGNVWNGPGRRRF